MGVCQTQLRHWTVVGGWAASYACVVALISLQDGWMLGYKKKLAMVTVAFGLFVWFWVQLYFGLDDPKFSKDTTLDVLGRPVSLTNLLLAAVGNLVLFIGKGEVLGDEGAESSRVPLPGASVCRCEALALVFSNGQRHQAVRPGRRRRPHEPVNTPFETGERVGGLRAEGRTYCGSQGRLRRIPRQAGRTHYLHAARLFFHGVAPVPRLALCGPGRQPFFPIVPSSACGACRPPALILPCESGCGEV